MLVPTRELCIQVHDVLAPLGEVSGTRLAIVYGGAPLEKQARVLAERRRDRRRHARPHDRPARPQGRSSLDDIEHVVLDEADRMADMGFLPQVEWILRHTDRQHQTLLFSATLDGAVKVLVDRYQHDPVFHEVESDDGHRRRDDPPVRAGARARQDQGGRRHLPVGAPHDPLHPHEAHRRPARSRAAQGGHRGRRHPRRPAAAGAGERRSRGSPTGRCRRWSPPTSPPAASTSTTSRSSCTTTRPRTTRRTCTAPAAPREPARPGWR